MKEKIKNILKSEAFIVYIIACILLIAVKGKWDGSFLEGGLLGLVCGIIIVLIEVMEKHILKHFTLIIFFLIFLFLLEKEKVIEYKDLYLLLGGLFAFWYGYKKYERDKEIELLEKYNLRLNILKGEIINIDHKKNSSKLIYEYKKMIDIFYEQFFLYSKQYISRELWYDFKENIEIEVSTIIEEDTNKKDFLILKVLQKYLRKEYHSNVFVDDKNFFQFILQVIKNKCISDEVFINSIVTSKNPYTKDNKIAQEEYERVVKSHSLGKALIDTLTELENFNNELSKNKKNLIN